MGRGVWTRRWLAASGGVLVNGLILGALVLIEEPPPLLEEPPVIILDLEKPERRTAPQRQAAAAGARSVARATPARSSISKGEGLPAVAAPSAPSAPAADPAWSVDPKVVDRWRLLEGNASMGTGRLKRACLGLSNEHMTSEEKEACYNGWGHRPDKRPSPNFIGPIDETKWETPEPKPPQRFDERRKQRCRDYRRGRTPGFAERNLSTGGPPPRLSEGGCF
jgi:hypothetical protein